MGDLIPFPGCELPTTSTSYQCPNCGDELWMLIVSFNKDGSIDEIIDSPTCLGCENRVAPP